MMNTTKQLNLLGLAQRARKLATGEELSVKAIQRGEAQLVIVASDCSENTRKLFENKTTYYKVPVDYSFTKEEMSIAIGKSRSIITILDKGFAASYLKLKGTNGMN